MTNKTHSNTSQSPFTEFIKWKMKVSFLMESIYSISPDDLPDYDYWVDFVAGKAPLETAHDVINHCKKEGF